MQSNAGLGAEAQGLWIAVGGICSTTGRERFVEPTTVDGGRWRGVKGADQKGGGLSVQFLSVEYPALGRRREPRRGSRGEREPGGS